MAVLEEFLQEVYIDEELDALTGNSGDDTEKTPLEKMIQAHPNWFYSKGFYNYVLIDYNHKDDEGNDKLDFLMLRLINVNGMKNDPLCKEVIESLQGGMADINGDGNSDDEGYQTLKDVYGVTNNLKLYYCKDGLTTAKGSSYTDGSFLDGSKVVYSDVSGVSKAIAETNGGEIENQTLFSLRTNKELVVSNLSGLTDLNFLYDMPNLNKLILKNYSGSLEGIEKAYKLKSLYFENENGVQNLINVSGLSKNNKLEELYFYNPTDVEVQKIINEMSKTDYTKLKRLGFYGDKTGFNDISNTNKKISNSSFSNLSIINSLSNNTKKTIEKLYVGDNSIVTLDLQGFSGLNELKVNSNLINSIVNLPNSIVSLNIEKNVLNLADFEKINNISSLKNLYMSESGITNITGLKAGLEIFRDNDFPIIDTNLDNSNLISNLKSIKKLYINNKYSLIICGETVELAGTETEDEVSVLEGQKHIKYLNLGKNKNLSDDFLQDLLGSLELEILSANSTNLASLNYFNSLSKENKEKLFGIDIRGTEVTDLTPLNFETCKLKSLRFDRDYDLSTVEYLTKSIFTSGENYVGDNSVFYNSYGGLTSKSYNIYKSLEKCTFLTEFGMYGEKYTGREVLLVNVKNLEILGCTPNFSLKFSNNLKKVGRVNSQADFDFSGCNNLGEIRLWTAYYGNIKFPENPNENLKVTSCIGKYNAIYPIPNVCYSLSITWNSWGDELGYPRDVTFSTYETEAEIVKITNFRCNNLSKYLNGLTVEDLTVSSSYINYIPKIKNEEDVTNLDLSDNNINSLDNLSNYTSLKTLNLKNNLLSNTTVVKDENGNSKTLKTWQAITALPNLTTVKLEGNSDLTEFGDLSNSALWKNDGKNNFTKVR